MRSPETYVKLFQKPDKPSTNAFAQAPYFGAFTE